MKNVLKKLAAARLHIKKHPLKKDGTNKFSNYDYFTPELVSKIVNEACNASNIICVFSLNKDEFGYFGSVVTTDLETGEELTTIMRTDRPEIKATNVTQQMGGMNTYAKRYALMSLFDIEDNSIDFDSQNNTPPAAPEKPYLNDNTEAFTKAVAALQAGTVTIDKIKNKYKISSQTEAKLIEAVTK